MASSIWGTDSPIGDLLFTASTEFDFFQAVRLLGRIAPTRNRVGVGTEPGAEAVRFRGHPPLAFQASAIHSIQQENGGPPAMTVAFMGLTGIHGVLPTQYTELTLDQIFAGDEALRDFLDLFNHRLIALFYRAWEKHHFFIEYERRRLEESAEDAFTSWLFDLIGLGSKGLKGRLPVADKALLRYAGLISQRPHSASAMTGILRDYFSVPVHIEQFCGVWHRLEDQDLCFIGSDELSNQLGHGAVAGDAVWIRQSLITVEFGPLLWTQFQDFLPDGDAFRKAAGLIRFFLGDEVNFEIRTVLGAEEVPECCINSNFEPSARLGWSSWLKTDAFQDEARDALFGERELMQAGGLG
jgi:type VI secretion system protein ImpH